jgi:hypothetical protein
MLAMLLLLVAPLLVPAFLSMAVIDTGSTAGSARAPVTLQPLVVEVSRVSPAPVIQDISPAPVIQESKTVEVKAPCHGRGHADAARPAA